MPQGRMTRRTLTEAIFGDQDATNALIDHAQGLIGTDEDERHELAETGARSMLDRFKQGGDLSRSPAARIARETPEEEAVAEIQGAILMDARELEEDIEEDL